MHRLTWVKQPATGRWTERNETAFYVCQIALSAADFAKAVRAHWTIENRNHHVRDVTLGEDHSRIRVQPGPFTRIRSFALNIFGNDQKRATHLSDCFDNIIMGKYADMLDTPTERYEAGAVA